eukprot:1145328-Pelagomonas_calceolata.AAC.5
MVSSRPPLFVPVSVKATVHNVGLGAWGAAEENLPTPKKEKETHWLKRAVSPLHHEDYKKNILMGIWRVIGSTWLHYLTVRSIVVFNSMPSGNNLVGIHDRMGMKFARKFIGALLVKSQLFKMVEGVLSVASPTNTQKDGVE